MSSTPIRDVRLPTSDRVADPQVAVVLGVATSVLGLMATRTLH